MGIWLAEQNGRNIKQCTFRIFTTPICRAKRRKYQKCAARNYGTLVRSTRRRKYHKKTHTFIKYGTPTRRTKRRNLKRCTLIIYGAPVRRTTLRKSRKMHFHNLWDSCEQNKTSEISKNGLSGIMGLLCAEQNVETLKTLPFKNSGTPVRRTKRRKSQRHDFQEF